MTTSVSPSSHGGLIANLRQLLTRFQAGELMDLLSSRTHAPYLTRHRTISIVARTRLVALAFSGFTLLWIALDAVTLPAHQWQTLALARLLSVVIFLSLALAPDKERTLAQALALLAILLAAPLMLYVLASYLFHGADMNGLAAVNIRLYDALPFIVLAGLCIFPLVMLEGLLFALPVLVVVVTVQINSAGLDLVQLFSTLWILGLALGVYLLACATQLHYMMALLHRASYDPLTGALTRRSGVEVIDLQFRLANEQNTAMAIAFIDLDHFKTINDVHGHDAGDIALRDAATALHQLLRKADTIVRWGGEEFVIVMASTDDVGVRIVMNRMLHEWLGKRPDGTPLTASIGIAERITDGIDDWAELVKLADERMYVAKQSGRARCVFSAGEVLLPESATSVATAIAAA
ncbi:MAG: GGDEF domain-containing protein [Rhodocyclaceae bacterium]|nr:GGDEF domain-containing protein [Rhodocyclaceae bacterium]MDZ4215517.1 GGDEF domain-containing protein [Rhodocyclaceae bacterium]